MPYTVILRHNATGEERSIPQDGEWDDVADYMWADGGNYSCDCNRALFFYSWGLESDNRECGETVFRLPRVILADGSVIEVESLDPA